MSKYRDDVEGLLVRVEARTLHLTLDRPRRRNAITDDMVAAMTEILDTAGSDEAVRVIHLDATGEHFCSGFDLGLRDPTDVKPRAGATQRRMRHEVNRLIPAFLETQTPIVASVQGWCLGLGLNLALAADFAVVSDDARLRAPFVAAGFTPDSGAAWLLPRLVGVARAKDILMLGREVSGREAAEWGMVHSAVPAADLPRAATALVEQVGSGATVAIGLAKVLVNRGLTTPLEHHLADEALAMELSSRSEDFKEAARARRERREPDFRGR